jgi:hypothetical protein
LLVWPQRGRVLARRIDLLLLQRHAHRLGAQLALITIDPVVSGHARDLGLPIFASVEASRGRRWRGRPARIRIDRRQPTLDRASLRRPERAGGSEWLALFPWLPLALKIILFGLGLGGIAMLALATLPSATVTISPAAQPISATVAIVADPAATALVSDTVPARRVRVEVETTGLTATTGLTQIPSEPAAGTVVFTSLDGVVGAIPAGTGLRTTSGNPVRFRTLQTVKLDNHIGATASAEVQAIDLGPVGNVAPGQINAIDGPLGLALAATNPALMTGGARSQKRSVSAADEARLRDQLSQQLKSDALAAINSQLAPDEFLATESVTNTQQVAETYNLAVGEQAEAVQLTLRLAFTGLAINDNQARVVALATLVKQVPRGHTLLASSNRFTREADTHIASDGSVHFSVSASGVAVPVIDPERVRALITGLAVAQAQLRLARALPLSVLPIIVVQPGWYPGLPWMPFRITVVVRPGG